MKRVVKLINDNRYKVILGSFLVAFLLVFFISYSFAATVPVESVEIKSENLDYDKSDPGAWKITKSAFWLSKGKARITFEVDTVEKNYDRNRDIIFVVDSSASMYNGEFDQIKKDIASVLTLLKKDTKTNRVALIDFNDEARVLSDFTTDLDYISTLVNNIVPDGNTNYYQALVKVDDVLANYKYDSSKNVSVVFLTDGFPNVDIPNERTQYAYLKSQYSYLNVKAIQYGMTEAVLNDIKVISDKQYLANKDNIENIFHRAMFGAIEYDNFQITDNINSLYFSAEKAEASLGNVDVTDGKVVWNITDSVFDSGDSAKLTIDIALKDSTGNVSLYETNSSESILSKIDSTEEKINSSKTPVLASSYTVSYLGNAPAGCSVSNVPVAKKYLVFDTVGISSNIPICFGYQFKGWEIVTKDVEKIGDNSFVMPGFDIELKATWSKLSLNKSSTGTISESATLYKVIKNEAESGGLAKEYTGEHQDSIMGVGRNKIYHYYATSDDEGTAILNKNNVLFAGMCWQMIRTTDTGGVKMIYNGEPDVNGSCGTDRGYHFGTAGMVKYSPMPANVYYGNSYTYDSSASTYSLTGNVTRATWSDSTYNSIVGKYTCLSSTSSNGCSKIYYVDSYIDSTTAYLVQFASVIYYSYSGLMQYNLANDSPSYAGYMYNSVYPFKKYTSDTEKTLNANSLSTSYYYASNYTYTASTGKYKLTSAYKVSSTDDYASLKGKYTLMKTGSSSTRTSLYYIADVSGSTMLYIEITNGNSLSSYLSNYTYGSSYKDNGNGTYTINNPTTIRNTDWYSNYSNINGKYLCKNASNNTCSSLWYVTLVTANKFNYIDVNAMNYKYANSFTYQNGQYVLTGESTTFWNISDSNNYNKLNNAHYTCLNSTGTCSSVAYIYNVKPAQGGYFDTYYFYINLNSGEDINTALNKMLYADDVNKYDSTVKKSIESWYKDNLSNYTQYLEDTIYCNNRNIRNLHGWNANNGSVTESDYLEFEGFGLPSNLYCSNVTDRFSVSNSKAKLKYPIGLMSLDEMNLLNNDNARNNSYFSGYWLMSPAAFYLSGAMQTEIKSNIGLDYVEYNDGVRPAISLASGTGYTSGDGSMENPYVVDLDTN